MFIMPKDWFVSISLFCFCFLYCLCLRVYFGCFCCFRCVNNALIIMTLFFCTKIYVLYRTIIILNSKRCLCICFVRITSNETNVISDNLKTKYFIRCWNIIVINLHLKSKFICSIWRYKRVLYKRNGRVCIRFWFGIKILSLINVGRIMGKRSIIGRKRSRIRLNDVLWNMINGNYD